MKKNVIVPIFIPHLGCDNDCVFCNQKIITAKQEAITPAHIKEHIERYLKYYVGRDLHKEVGFFGGSFTGISIEEQIKYLEVAKSFKDRGLIDEIRLSTRPDYIDDEILKYLKEMRVDTIELGIQSFDEEVLENSKRGHTKEDSISACYLIKKNDFKLGTQLMIGLPKDTTEKSITSAEIASSFKPEYARLYPTLVLEDTELARMYENGEYTPFDFQKLLHTTIEMYKIFEKSQTYILRVGLKSTDNINTNSDMTSMYHPSFRQLVAGKIAREKIEDKIKYVGAEKVSITSSSKSFSSMIGYKAQNKRYFKEKYPQIEIMYIANDDVKDGDFAVEVICDEVTG